MSTLQRKRLFVTGGTGFVGSHFVELAQLGGHDVIASRRGNSQAKFQLTAQPSWINADLDQVPESILSGADCVVHFAAAGVTGTLCWEECFRVNVFESMRFWRRAISAGVKRLVVCGSCFEYGTTGNNVEYLTTDSPLCPVDAYGSSKAAATLAACALGASERIEVTVLRPFHVYGEGEHHSRFFPSLRSAAKSGADFKMSKGEQVRDFVRVEDVAAAFLRAAVETQLPPGSPVIENVCSGNAMTLAEFARMQWQQFNAPGRLEIGALPYRKNELMRLVGTVHSNMRASRVWS